jgi:cyclopropane fatty-acyl-phospholipid synthase-like methyltransferase
MAFYSSIVEGYYDWAARYFIRYFLHKATPLSQAEEESIFHEMRAAIIDLFVEASGKPQFSLVFGNLLKIIIKHKLQLSPVLSRLALTLTSAEGYILQLDPSFNMMENARRKKLEMTEYASVSPEAERLVLGEFGTYSMPMFRKGLSPAQAWALRDEFVFEQLALRPGEFVIDVGCGRGRHLELARSKGARALGLTISRTEQELCASRQLDCLLTSWEDFEHNAKDAYPIADAMLAIEMFPHLASLHENREGLLDYRLRRFFEWARKRLDAGGRLFIQSLDISEAFLHDPAHEAQFLAVSRALPWIGFSTREQIKGLCAPHFHVTQHWDGTSDLRPTFQLWSQNMELHTATLERILKPSVLAHLRKELAIMMELVASGHLTLSRWLLTASTAH